MYILSYDIASKSLAWSLMFINIAIIKKQKKLYSNITNKTNELSININKKNKKNIIKILNDINDNLENISCNKDNITDLLLFDIVDLIPNNKLNSTDSIVRSNRLRSYLNFVDSILYDKILENEKKYNINKSEKEKIQIYVLLEYQMGPNDKSRNVGSQILYNYSQKNDINFNSIIIQDKINELYKNNISKNIDLDYITEIIGPSLKNKINFDKNKNYQYFMNKYTNKYNANKKHSTHNLLTWIKFKKKTKINNNIYDKINKVPKKNLDDIADSITMALAWLYFKFNID